MQSQRLVASYAVPPQTYFCCAPCSIYIRATDSTPAQRRTYLVLKDKADSVKRRLLCFTGILGKNKEDTGATTSPGKFECNVGDGEIVGVDVTVGPSDRRLSILVGYSSGKSDAVSADLQHVHEFLPASADEEIMEYASTVDPNAAVRGLLKSREDIVGSTGVHNGISLCTVSRCGHERVLRLYSGRVPQKHGPQTFQLSHRLLLEHELPQNEEQASSPASFDLHTASGRLHQHGNQRLCIYDLTGTVPKLATRVGTGSTPVLGFTRLSPSLTLTLSTSTVALYETKYGSLYGTLSMASDSRAESKKRKREDNDLESAELLEQMCSVADQGPVVALRRRDLVVLSLSETLRSSKRARSKTIRLADIVRRNQTGNTPSRQEDGFDSGFSEWTATVDELIETDDIEELESMVAHDPGLGLQRDLELFEGEGPNGDKVAYDELWPLPEPCDASRLDNQRALYILGRMFSSTEDGIAVRILSLKLLEWLALAGLLSGKQIRKAWSTMHRGGAQSYENQIRSGDVMLALQPYDEDFQLSHNLLTLPVRWEIEEIIEVLRSILQSFEEPVDAANGPLALPAIPQRVNGDVASVTKHLANGEGSSDSDIELETKAAEQELDHAMSALSNGLEVRSDTLRVIFSCLLSFDSHTVTTKLREIMSHRELIFFIHVLRIELADGGWTSRYISTGNSNEGEEQGMVNAVEGVEEGGPNNEALKTIGDLLNCAVDAIGVSGWLVGLGSTSATAKELLNNLRAEVSAGLEQCYEADTLGSALGVFEKFAGEVEMEHSSGGTMPIDEGSDGGEAKLPMGGRIRPPMVEGRNGADVKKSRIARAQETSRRVGAYSFDRIRI